MKHWRPEGWNNSYRNAFELQGRVDTELEYYGKCFEAGADAMLEVLRTSYVTSSPWTPYDNEMHGTWAMIPDDPQPVKEVPRDPWCSLWDKQPSEKPQSNERHLFEAYAPGACVRSDICILCGHLKDDSTFHIKPAEPQLMICPKAKECGDKCEFPPHTIPHIKDNTGCLANAGISHCPACVPYVPEKETISGWWLNHITGNKEFATINIPPFIKVKIEDNQGYHLQHPASKVIESGYLEIVFGKGLVEVPKLSCTFTRN